MASFSDNRIPPRRAPRKLGRNDTLAGLLDKTAPILYVGERGSFHSVRQYVLAFLLSCKRGNPPHV